MSTDTTSKPGLHPRTVKSCHSRPIVPRRESRWSTSRVLTQVRLSTSRGTQTTARYGITLAPDPTHNRYTPVIVRRPRCYPSSSVRKSAAAVDRNTTKCPSGRPWLNRRTATGISDRQIGSDTSRPVATSPSTLVALMRMAISRFGTLQRAHRWKSLGARPRPGRSPAASLTSSANENTLTLESDGVITISSMNRRGGLGTAKRAVPRY